jgi:LemA protein
MTVEVGIVVGEEVQGVWIHKLNKQIENKTMKKLAIFFAVGVVALIGLILICGLVALGMYQGVIQANNEVDDQWGKVQSVYQRRSDLIPNLVSTVKAAAAFEKDTFTQVAQARAAVGQIKVDPTNPADIQKFAQAQQGLGSALSRLMVVSEKYPELHANSNFLELQAQLEGTENRISVERGRYNDAVLNVNNKVTIPPSSFFASMAGIRKREYFKADEKAQAAPTVQF